MYIPLNELLLYWLAVLILAITPGVDVVFIASQTMISRKNGLLAVLGTTTGIAIYIGLTILGLTLVLQHSLILYNIIKYAGVLYLLYLAYLSYKSDGVIGGKIIVDKVSGFESYKKGFLTNILNPKIGVFFITFLPQFVSPKFGHQSIQFLILGISFLIIGSSINVCYAFLFYTFKDGLFKKITFMKVFNKVVAVLFCLMALKVAIG
jgi:threonine/homoserine/homoserine lactone efflux protein